ncbi:MAG: hydroxyisourate hydrolase [Alphaproteobacteria bacterium]|nr:hydroxyisourate hydrolase [Alphaproteobacteria bacterium]
MSADGGYLTTHVLDTARGCPAENLQIELYRLKSEAREYVVSMPTNADGRTDFPILPADKFVTGEYELVFQAGAYLRRANGINDSDIFLDLIPIRFTMTEPASHYHVPLLLSPYGYSTYRGS